MADATTNFIIPARIVSAAMTKNATSRCFGGATRTPTTTANIAENTKPFIASVGLLLAMTPTRTITTEYTAIAAGTEQSQRRTVTASSRPFGLLAFDDLLAT